MVLVYTCVAKAAPRQAYQCTVRALGSALAQVARRRAQAGGAPAYHKVVVQRDKAHFFKQKFGTIWVKKSSVFRVSRARGRARRACKRCTIRPYRIRCICPRLLPLAYPCARGIVRQHAFHVCVGMPSKRSLSPHCARCQRFKAARWWQAPPLRPYGPYTAMDAAQETPWRARGGREGRQKLGRQGAMRTPYVQ